VPVFSRVLILKNGRVLATGRKTAVLNSKNLARAFGTRMQLRRTGNRYALTVTARSRGLM
jgi:ABC-type cobalamin transport system ATPase subunit